VQLFAEIVDDILVGIEMFDIELFAAHLSDWKSRVYEIGREGTSLIFFIIFRNQVHGDRVRQEVQRAGEDAPKLQEVLRSL
jgi:hypothetical protein